MAARRVVVTAARNAWTPGWLETFLGTVLVLLVLSDTFLAVLSARAGDGIIDIRLARLTWLAFPAAAGVRGVRAG